jgi:ABC-type nitrate/sulfonate/bicarbonate transport system substrate-binding protein
MITRRHFLRNLVAAPLLTTGCRWNGAPSDPDIAELKVGHFIGGKTYVLYRAFYNGRFDDTKTPIQLYSRFMHQNAPFIPVPRNLNTLKKWRKRKEGKNIKFGKVSGIEVLDAIMKGELHGGTVGESSFLSYIQPGMPLVAVALLQRDSIERPAKAIAIRKDLTINKPEDLKGLCFASRRAGPGEEVLLYLYLDSLGIDWKKNMKIIPQMDDHIMESELGKSIDGGLFHITTIRRLHKAKTGKIHRLMDWASPHLSFGLLVFHADVVEKNPEAIRRLLQGYQAQIKYEETIPIEEKLLYEEFPLRMAQEFQGMSLPQNVNPPFVNLNDLDTVQAHLHQYGFINQTFSLESFVNRELLASVL